jgi:hypothetical protein
MGEAQIVSVRLNEGGRVYAAVNIESWEPGVTARIWTSNTNTSPFLKVLCT